MCLCFAVLKNLMSFCEHSKCVDCNVVYAERFAGAVTVGKLRIVCFIRLSYAADLRTHTNGNTSL